MSEELYDGELSDAVEKLMENQAIPKSVKEGISYFYWAIGHELADDRDIGVVLNATNLASFAAKCGQLYIAQLAREFLKLYESESEEREAKRKKEAEEQRRKYTPEKTLEEDLKKLNPNSSFPGMEIMHFNSLYGPITIPDSELVAPYAFRPSRLNEKTSYIIGEDKRSVGEIYAEIRYAIEERVNRAFQKEIVQVEVNALTEYVGPIDEVHVIIAKELILPEKVREIKKIKWKEEETAPGRIGKYDREIIKTLQKEGLKLGTKTIIEIWVGAAGIGVEKLREELMDIVLGILSKDGYRIEKLPWLCYGYNHESPGCARADIYEIADSMIMFVGELKEIEFMLPCGKTRSQILKEWDELDKRYREEIKQVRKRDLTREEEAKMILERYGIVLGPEGEPTHPCNFRKDTRVCTPEDCRRGRYISKSEAQSSKDYL
jgi:hypothetical protein